MLFLFIFSIFLAIATLRSSVHFGCWSLKLVSNIKKKKTKKNKTRKIQYKVVYISMHIHIVVLINIYIYICV